MIAYVLHGKRDLRAEERPDPVAAPGEVLVQVRRMGICGSDVHYFATGHCGAFMPRRPFVLGHEFAGQIVETGSGVSGLAAGQRVAVDPIAFVWRLQDLSRWALEPLPGHEISGKREHRPARGRRVFVLRSHPGRKLLPASRQRGLHGGGHARAALGGDARGDAGGVAGRKVGVTQARARDGERRPSRSSRWGFELSEKLDDQPPRVWESLTASGSIFLQPRFVRAVERTGPANFRHRYATAYRDGRPVLAVATQLIELTGEQLRLFLNALEPSPPPGAIAASVLRAARWGGPSASPSRCSGTAEPGSWFAAARSPAAFTGSRSVTPKTPRPHGTPWPRRSSGFAMPRVSRE